MYSCSCSCFCFYNFFQVLSSSNFNLLLFSRCPLSASTAPSSFLQPPDPQLYKYLSCTILHCLSSHFRRSSIIPIFPGAVFLRRWSILLPTQQPPDGSPQSRCNRRWVSTDRPREKQARKLIEQNCQKPIEKNKDNCQIITCCGKQDLCLGKRLLRSQFNWVKQFDCLSKRDIHVWP